MQVTGVQTQRAGKNILFQFREDAVNSSVVRDKNSVIYTGLSVLLELSGTTQPCFTVFRVVSPMALPCPASRNSVTCLLDAPVCPPSAR